MPATCVHPLGWDKCRLARFKDGGHSQPCVGWRKRGWQVLKMAASVSHVCVGGNEAGKILRWRPLPATWTNKGPAGFQDGALCEPRGWYNYLGGMEAGEILYVSARTQRVMWVASRSEHIIVFVGFGLGCEVLKSQRTTSLTYRLIDRDIDG